MRIARLASVLLLALAVQSAAAADAGEPGAGQFGSGCAGTSAVKYYLNKTGHTWAFGAFYWYDTAAGIVGEYLWRWRLDRNWEGTLGIALGRTRVDDDRFWSFLPTATFGYFL